MQRCQRTRYTIQGLMYNIPEAATGTIFNACFLQYHRTNAVTAFHSLLKTFSAMKIFIVMALAFVMATGFSSCIVRDGHRHHHDHPYHHGY